MFELSEDTKESVRTKERAISTKQQELSRATGKVSTHETASARMWKNMNYRERYLAGWFGGDKQKVTDYKNEVQLKEDFEGAAVDITQEIELLDKSIITSLDGELRLNDVSYKELLVPLEAVKTLKEAIDRFLKEIDEALYEVDDAENVETLDLFTSNTAISVLSYLENEEASDEIDDVTEGIPAFQKAVQDYNAKMKTVDLSSFSAGINDGWDLAFDLAFDGFDFMSIFTLSALGDAEDKLEEIRSKVEDVEDMANKHLAQAEGNVSSYIRQARLSCA